MKGLRCQGKGRRTCLEKKEKNMSHAVRKMTAQWIRHTNFVRAIIFVVRVAVLALKASRYLRTNTYAVAYFDGRHLFADFDSLADNLMPYTEGHGSITPAAVDGMNV